MQLRCHLLDSFRLALKDGDGVPSKEGLFRVATAHQRNQGRGTALRNVNKSFPKCIWLLEDFKHFFLTHPVLKYLLKLGTGNQTYVCTEAFIQPVSSTQKPLPKWYSYFLPSTSQGEFFFK